MCYVNVEMNKQTTVFNVEMSKQHNLQALLSFNIETHKPTMSNVDVNKLIILQALSSFNVETNNTHKVTNTTIRPVHLLRVVL